MPMVGMPFIDVRYAYFVGTLLFGAVWLIFFLLRKDTRREMLAVSLAVGFLAVPWAPWFFRDYWYPTYAWFFGLEDFLYGFFAGGIVGVAYEVLFHHRLGTHIRPRRRWVALLAGLVALSAVFFIALWHAQVNSIYAAFAAFAVFIAGLLWLRADLAVNALVSGLLFMIITFFFYLSFLSLFPNIVEAWWNLAHISGMRVVEIPIEELIWAFGMGMAGGPLYEFLVGRKTAVLT